MVSDRAAGFKRSSCGIVIIGKNPLLRKRIAFVLRVAGFRIATSAPDADPALLRAVICEHETVSIFEVNSGLEETPRDLKNFEDLSSMCWFRNGKAEQDRYLTPKKRRRSARATDADGIPVNPASSRVAAAAAAGDSNPTHRQAMILESLVNGDSNKVVARKLDIAEETVKVHMKRLLRRIGVKNRTQAAIWALNNHFAPAASVTEDLQRARSFTRPRSARRSAGPKTELRASPGPRRDK